MNTHTIVSGVCELVQNVKELIFRFKFSLILLLLLINSLFFYYIVFYGLSVMNSSININRTETKEKAKFYYI